MAAPSAQMMDRIPSEAPSKPVENTVTEPEKAGSLGQSSYASPPAFQTDNLVPQEVDTMMVSSQPTATLVSPPTSQADEADERADREGVVFDSHQAIQTPASSSRHSSRQPRHVVPEVQAAKPTTATAAPPPPPRRRRASFAASAGVRKTPPAKKPASRPTSSHAKSTASGLSGHGHGHGHGQTQAQGQGQNPELDEDSLRLIREIQEQEFGLRKRSTRA